MPEKSPTVSVIIPTYNRAHLIRRAIQSVLNQTYQDFEIIIVDDGSTDDTEEVVKSFKNERIRYIRQEKNEGAAAARNTGIKMAKGEYIAFQDSDDEWLPEKLEKQMKILENASPDLGVVYTSAWKVWDGKKIYEKSPTIMPYEGYICKDRIDLRVKGIFLQSALIKKRYLLEIDMLDESLPRYHDLDLFIRLAKRCRFYHLDEPLFIYYYRNPDAICVNEEKAIQAWEILLKKYAEELSKDKQSYLRCTAMYAFSAWNAKRYNKSLQYYKEVLKLSFPRNLKYAIFSILRIIVIKIRNLRL
ncbi:MAG: hypothetical protein B5M53_05570 [Candidatus Cloacimonas sp. 4484_209]|nr:MAG: hypothetical protein B5M53_05570 [Candidatus Cloacimonas sp. 4484_209]